MVKKNCALIGYGYWGKRLEKYLTDSKKFDVSTIYFRHAKKGGRFTNDINDVLDNKKIDCVAIASPINTHYELAKESLLHGKHVLCEKPLSMNPKEIHEIYLISEKENLNVVTEFTYTFSKSLELATQIINDGIIDEIDSIEMSLKYAGRFLDYSVYWLLTSHLLSILDMFVSLDNCIFEKRDFIINDIVETGSLFFNSGKITGVLNASLNYPEKFMKVIIYGKKGTIIYSSMDDNSLILTTYNKQKGVLGKDLTEYRKVWKMDEKNNLNHAVDYFYDVLYSNNISNIERAFRVSSALRSAGC